MEVVLLQDVKSLGKKGQIVKVNDGYARNFLIPKKLGAEANNASLNDLKLQKAHEARVAKELLESAKELAEKIEAGEVIVSVKTGEGGRVFGSVSGKEIAAAAKEQLGLELDKKKFVLDDAIKTIGMHEVTVKLHKDVYAKLKVNVSEA